MIHAYDKIYLAQARNSLGLMIDFVVYDLEQDLNTFWEVFINSDICKKFEKGSSRVVAGMSGVEMAYEVLGDKYWEIERKPVMNRSAEYWLGWALAYYQWDTGLSFKKIDEMIDIMDLFSMYTKYHEIDIRHFCDKLNEIYYAKNADTNLKKIRQKSGLSQSQLAIVTDIPVRTIQQYEQRQKDINRARAEYLIKFAKALYCDPEDLLEKI